jgi:parvulin-like peptidyl-prolyl isomerase
MGGCMHKNARFASKLIFLFSGVVFSSPSFALMELAKINDKVITLEEFNSKYKENQKFFRFKAPTKKNVLEDMIKHDLGVQEAKKLGLDKDPEVIERINTVLYHSLLDKKLSSKFDAIQVDNDEIESYYKKNPEIRTSHIFVQVRFDATAAQEKAAHEKIEKIKKILDEAAKSGKQTFAEIARTYSEGIAAAAGGDIDYQSKDKLDPIYYQTALGLKKPGAVSGIVRSQFGYHIIKLTGIKEFKDIDRGLYKRLVFDEKRTSVFDTYMEDLKKKANVTVHYDLIKE